MYHFLNKIYKVLFDFNASWVPDIGSTLRDSYIAAIIVLEVLLLFLIVVKIAMSFFRGTGLRRRRVEGDVNYAGGFRRRFERVQANEKIDYRLDQDSEFKKAICKDISAHGMKIEVSDETPEIHQRIELILDGKKLKLGKDDRVKIGGFIVRVIEKDKNTYDLGIEFYHLFRNQNEMIEAIIEKKKK